jgi:FlaA1/EpsC-like NDP-sugar epimerase
VIAARRLARVGLDLAILALALGLAFALRFDGSIPTIWLRRMLVIMPWVLLTQYLALIAFDVPRCSWRYFGLVEARKLAAAIAAAGAVLLGLRLAAPLSTTLIPALVHARIPLGVVAADLVLAFLGLAGVRALRRWTGEHTPAQAERPPARIMLIGAGEAGVAVARALARSRTLECVAFVDDDPNKRGLRIHGVPVRGNVDQLATLARRHGVDELLITVARGDGALVRRVTRAADELGLPVKIIPGVDEFIDGSVAVERIREVALEDLLRREPATLDDAAIGALVQGRVVLVSGAGGSIGSELCRQICRYAPRRVILLERSENALFHVHRELGDAHPEIELVPALVDIGDRPNLRRVLAEQRPAVVLHAAAHKHVPMLEHNPSAAILNNVVGTRNIAELAREFGVGSFVMISTDKATRPRSIMGASKRCAERLIQIFAREARLADGGTRYVTVRFGNVLGSNGSVVPIFKEQIARFGPVTVTHPEVERYFMTIPEASQLVLQAASMGTGGEIFILDMGEPVKILELAHDLIRLSGLTPGDDVAIEFTGLRPGEKLHEELCSGDGLAPTRHPAILVERELGPGDVARFELELAAVVRAAERGDELALRRALRRALPDFDDGRSEADPDTNLVPLRAANSI